MGTVIQSCGRINIQPNVLRALTKTTFGQSKEDITLMYKQYIKPILSYSHTEWQPDTAASYIQKEQIALNSATGCIQTLLIPRLQRETLLLPLKQHLLMKLPNPTYLHHFRSASAPRQSTPTSHYWHYNNDVLPNTGKESSISCPPFLETLKFVLLRSCMVRQSAPSNGRTWYVSLLLSLHQKIRSHHSALIYTQLTPYTANTILGTITPATNTKP